MSWKINYIRALKVRQKKVLLGMAIFFCVTLWIGIDFFIQSRSKMSDQKNISQKKTSYFVSVRDPANALLPPSPGVIPAGTQMMIPPWVLQQYHLSPQNALYGDALNYLIYNYGKSAPSIDDKDKDDIYIPLTRYKSKDFYRSYKDDDYYDRGRDDTVMAPITALRIGTGTESSIEEGSESAESVAPGPESPSAEPDEQAETPPETPPSASEAEPTEPEVVVSNVAFTVTAPVDTTKTPPVPEILPEQDLATTYPATCDEEDNFDRSTEAIAPCVKCNGEERDFLTEVGNTVNTFVDRKNFSSVISKMCDDCSGIDINDLVEYIEDRSQSEDVPPEIMFAIMLRESNGACNATGDSGKSFGLFQLNTKNSTKLRACERNELERQSAGAQKQACVDGAYRTDSRYRQVTYPNPRRNLPGTPFNQRPNIGTGVCLNNPYCNFEEALHLLKEEKWPIGNKRVGNGRSIPKPSGKSWVEMSGEERNLWRNAIIAYNGDHYHGKAKGAMKEYGVDHDHFDDWEQKRIYFVRQYLDNPNTNNSSAQGFIHNLAYMERIAGREVRGGLAQSSICQWTKFRTQNRTLSCHR